MRYPKMFIQALLAVLALSAVVASAAQAEFTVASGATKVRVAQEGKNVFFTEAGEIGCSSATGEGAVSPGTTNELNFTPSYSGCTAFGQPAHVTMLGGCTARITSDGIVHLCPAGGDMKVTTTSGGMSICTAYYHKQTMSIAAFNNIIGAPNKVKLIASGAQTFTGIEYEIEGGGGTCGTVGKHSDGEFEGNIRMEAVNSGGSGVNLTYD
jgi:hypothetical protein